MPMFRVFHLDNAPFPEMREAQLKAMLGDFEDAVGAGLYSEVAHVEADRLDDVFRLTNHIDKDWTKGTEICRSKPRCRSTSVGDIVMDQHDNLYSCDTIGWRLLDDETACMFREDLGKRIELLDPLVPDSSLDV